MRAVHRLFRTRKHRAALAALTPPGRAMGMLEHGFDCMHHIGAFVIVQIACLDGALGEATLRRALDALQLMHPLLRVHVRGPGGIFEARGTEPIPLRVVERDGPEGWRSEALAQLHQPIPYGRHPLLRAVWIRGADNGELILVSNHAVLDGAAGVVLVRDLLDLCARVDGGEALPPAAAAAVSVPPIDQCLPEQAHGPKPKFMLPPLLPVDTPARAAERRSHVEYFSVARETMRGVQERCREEGTTVNGAICAAALLAVRSALTGDREVSLQSQVGVRGALVPPVSEDTIGCFISGVTTVHKAVETVSFWELAREVRQSVAAAVERGDHLTILEGRFTALHAFAVRHLGPRFLYGRTAALNVTNAGRLDVPLVYGPRRLRELYAGASQHVLGSTIQIAAWTLGGTMFASCTHVEPLLSDAHAQQVVREFELLVARVAAPGDVSLATLRAQSPRVDAA